MEKPINKLLLYYQRTTGISDNMAYKRAAIDQEIFVRDTLGNLFQKAHIFVVSRHKAKGIDLYTYQVFVRNGLSITLSNNFYGWVVSIKLPYPLQGGYVLPTDLFFNTNNSIPIYCDGFKSEWVYGPYKLKNCTEFTIQVADNYKLYTLLYLINSKYNWDFSIKSDEPKSESEILESIKNIYTTNGVYEIVDNSPVLMPYEVLTHTFNVLEQWFGNSCYDIIKDPAELTRYIMKYPKVMEGFKTDEYMYYKQI